VKATAWPSRATPYLPVRDLLRQLWDLPDATPATATTAIVQQWLREAGVRSEDEALLLLQLLDVPVDRTPAAALDPPLRKARTFGVLSQVIRHANRRQPLVLVVENLHWSDPTSEECLASLVERLGDLPVLFLVTYRPGYQPPWIQHSAVTQMALPRLSPRDSLVVLQSVPQAAQLPAARQQAIVARAAGNPFFVEELTWAAVEHGDHAGTLPLLDTIAAVLAARMDRLPPGEKRLLQTAAVIGTEIPVPLLQQLIELPADVLQRGLASLQTREFLYEMHFFPEQAYRFKHALTREVAYESLLHERRRALHRQIMEALEALQAERRDEPVERLAHHALRGEVWEKAVAYCQQVGARAHARAAFREAVAAFEQALQALAHLHEHGDLRGLGIELRLALNPPLNALGEYGQRLTLLREAKALARALNDRAQLVRVLAGMAQLFRITGDRDGAMAVGQQALELAAELGENALQAEAAAHLGEAYYAIGEFGQAAEVLRRSVEAADRESGPSSTVLRIRSRAWLAQTLGELGAFVEGRRHGEAALRLATMAARESMPILAHRRLGHLYLAQGDLAHAIRVFEQGLALRRASGERDLLRGVVAGLGYAYALRGRLAEGRALLEEGIGESTRTGGWAIVPGTWHGSVRSVVWQDTAMRPGSTHAKRSTWPSSTRHAGTRRGRCTIWAPSKPTPIPRCRTGRSSLPTGSGPSRGAGHAATAGPLPPRPRHPVREDWSTGAGPRRPGHGHRALPRHGYHLLAAPGQGGAGGAGVKSLLLPRANACMVEINTRCYQPLDSTDCFGYYTSAHPAPERFQVRYLTRARKGWCQTGW
jgi:tetratricopeptide (TPR) repeat protein